MHYLLLNQQPELIKGSVKVHLDPLCETADELRIEKPPTISSKERDGENAPEEEAVPLAAQNYPMAEPVLLAEPESKRVELVAISKGLQPIPHSKMPLLLKS